MKTEQQKETELLTEFIRWMQATVPTNHLGYRDIQWPDTFTDGMIHWACWPKLFAQFHKERPAKVLTWSKDGSI